MNDNQGPLRTVNVTRYVTPLREGGSLPAIAEADDGFLYVLKFRGAGQGVKALVAELIGGEIARTLGLKVPEIVFAQLDSAFGRTEPDEEIQDLLKASVGLNLGLHYLSGAITYDPTVTTVQPLPASRIVWLDCLLTNVDRTARNTNMLVWNKELWLIDHGAALYFHHSWDNYFAEMRSQESNASGKTSNDWPSAAMPVASLQQQALKPFIQVKDHVLLSRASELDEVDKAFRKILTPQRIRSIVDLIPDEWLTGGSTTASPSDRRQVYWQFLTTRIAASEIFVKEAQHARESLI
jgi:hypothetical protein